MNAALIPGAELQEITRQLLTCGADIVEMNSETTTPITPCRPSAA